MGMKITLTAKLKLVTTPDQFRALRATQLAYRAALNHVSAYSFAHRKTSNRKRLQKATYADLRRQFGLPAQMACNVPRQVGATYQGLWTKARKNAEARRLGERLATLQRAGQSTPLCVSDAHLQPGPRLFAANRARGEHPDPCGADPHPLPGLESPCGPAPGGSPIGGAKLWYDRGKQRFFLLVSLTLEAPDPTPERQRQVLGVDVGQRYLATVATLDNGAQFSSGKEIRAKADHYARLQKRLQRKGTRSATRRRIALGTRERRLKLNTNHAIAKHILDTHPHACIGLEALSGIRDRTKRKHGKKATKRQHRANRHASKWAFSELHGLLTYKAALAGSLCIKVDADYTSQTCPRCGFTSRENRPQHGLLFLCQQCHYTLHADLVGARNIALRTLVIRHDWMATGQLSDAPDVTDHEAKAARLSRYAELRWSPATSPLLEQWGI